MKCNTRVEIGETEIKLRLQTDYSGLTIPVEVKGKYFQKINETRIADKNWAEKHWNSIVHNYSKSQYFKETSDLIKSFYELAAKKDTLTEVNMIFLEGISKFLSIKTKFLYSKDFHLLEDKTERLVSISKELGGSCYFTGEAARSYMNEQLFKEAGIELKYFDYSEYPEYSQLHGSFEHGVSILDLLFNTGHEYKSYLKSFK